MAINDVVVGADGSPHSEQAVRWAAQEAKARGAALRIVLAYEWVTAAVDAVAGPPAPDSDVRARVDGTLAAAVDLARTSAPGVDVTGEAVYGPPVPALFAAAARASLVVVGSRGHGGFVNLLLGSVSQQLATHAPCPVAVIRDGAVPHDGPVVAGVDLSDATGEVLGAAFAAAAAAEANLVVIHAHQLVSPQWGIAAVPLVPDEPGYDDDARARMTAAVAVWREKYPDVAVETLIAHGHPAHVLADVSSTARLVVVGTRGHGGFAGLLLGSVAQQLLHHATAPVLIVR